MKTQTKKTLGVTSALALAAIAVIGTGFFGTHDVDQAFASVTQVKAVATAPTLTDKTTAVYTLDGYNVPSYVETDSIAGSGIVEDGTEWDEFYLVNPEVEGERVYLPVNTLNERQKKDGLRHFFFLDSLRRETGRVYIPRNRVITSYRFNGIEPVAEKELDNQWKDSIQTGQLVIVDPEVDRKGKSWVYFQASEEEVRRFFFRKDLVLVQ